MEQKKLSILETCNCPHCVELRQQQARAEELQMAKMLVKVATNNNCL